MSHLEDDIRYLKGVGEARAERFKKLGADTVGALLRIYPRRYIDMSAALAPLEAPLDTPCAVRATVWRKQPLRRIPGGRTLARVEAGTSDSELTLTYFNNRYGPAALTEGVEYVFYGRVTGGLLHREMVNPLCREASDAGIVPEYPRVDGLSSKIIAKSVKNALELCGGEIVETLPGEMLENHSLMGRAEALRAIHLPASLAEAAEAKRRLIFEELLCLQLGMKLIKGRARESTAAVMTGRLDDFIESLPFAPTGAQRRSMGEIAADLARSQPMSRLLQGDVGSGKTVVAAAGVFLAAQNGFQSAVMAPTEILAAQHAETFERLLAPFGVSVGLLTGSVKGRARTRLLERIASGDCSLVVGTHAILSGDVAFKKLGLVVADEQHRFGVEQRGALSAKGERPHLLVMSATPIPRTLALIIYGDLDISVLDQLPPGRRPVKTLLVDKSYRKRYTSFIAKAVERGEQAFIVCPLVEESEQSGERLAAVSYRESLSNDYLPGIDIALVHGRMRPKEKAAAMESFTTGKCPVLVSTTVIEVGVDVPKATIMLIENAELFGLSELHQLRGRVGRGALESWCILVSDYRSGPTSERLKIMTRTASGFEIARFDLEQRGPGDFFGRRQSGLPELYIADLAEDQNTLYSARDAADRLLERDAALERPEHALLAAEVGEMFARGEGKLN